MERWESRRVPARAGPSFTPEEREMTRSTKSEGRCFALHSPPRHTSMERAKLSKLRAAAEIHFHRTPRR
jgi:hypothetical protein